MYIYILCIHIICIIYIYICVCVYHIMYFVFAHEMGNLKKIEPEDKRYLIGTEYYVERLHLTSQPCQELEPVTMSQKPAVFPDVLRIWLEYDGQSIKLKAEAQKMSNLCGFLVAFPPRVLRSTANSKNLVATQKKQKRSTIGYVGLGHKLWPPNLCGSFDKNM